MLRKILLGLTAITALALAMPGTASARGGFHGYHGGFGWGPRFGGYYGYGPYGYGYGWGYPLIYRYEGPGGCHLAHQRVRTAKGWRVRTVDVCE